MKSSSRIKLVEEDIWEVQIPPEVILASLAEITGNQFLVDQKKRTNLYIGKIKSAGFRIRENPSITQMNSASGTLNRSVISGDIRPSGKGSLLHVRAHQFNLRSFFTLLGPIMVGAVVLGAMKFESWTLLVGVSVIIALELLLVRGINEEVGESLAVLEKRLRGLEEKYLNDD